MIENSNCSICINLGVAPDQFFELLALYFHHVPMEATTILPLEMNRLGLHKFFADFRYSQSISQKFRQI